MDVSGILLWFDLHSVIVSDGEHLFKVLIDHLCIFGEMSKFFAHFLAELFVICIFFAETYIIHCILRVFVLTLWDMVIIHA